MTPSRSLRSTVIAVVLAALLSALLAACGLGGDTPIDSDDSPPPPAGSGGPEPVLVVTEGPTGEPGITVSQAFEHRPTDDIVAVSGALFVGADGSVLLCEAIAESFPPQCGGARIAVERLDLASVALEEAQGVRWAESVTLVGSVE